MKIQRVSICHWWQSGHAIAIHSACIHPLLAWIQRLAENGEKKKGSCNLLLLRGFIWGKYNWVKQKIHTIVRLFSKIICWTSMYLLQGFLQLVTDGKSDWEGQSGWVREWACGTCGRSRWQGSCEMQYRRRLAALSPPCSSGSPTLAEVAFLALGFPGSCSWGPFLTGCHVEQLWVKLKAIY